MEEFGDLDINAAKDDLLCHIAFCDHLIKQTQEDKQASESKLKDLFDHNLFGSTKYRHGNREIVITTGLNYRFDKKKYLELLDAPEKIDPKFKIVKEVTDFQLNKKAIKELDEFGSPQDKYLKSLFVTTTEKKLHISIKETKDESITGDIGSVDADGVFVPSKQ